MKLIRPDTAIHNLIMVAALLFSVVSCKSVSSLIEPPANDQKVEPKITDTGSNPSSSTPYTADLVIEMNGFKRTEFEDVTSRQIFPGAKKAGAGSFSDGSSTIYVVKSLFASPTEAQTAFNNYLEKLKNEGSKIGEKAKRNDQTGESFFYTDKKGEAGYCLFSNTVVYDYSSQSRRAIEKMLFD